MKTIKTLHLESDQFANFFAAVKTSKRIKGLTHSFYRYPARFSPHFPASAIRCFSKPGDLILDPYMGGGTTIVEALATGRRAIGNDLNELAVFVTRVKTRPLGSTEIKALRVWAREVLPTLNYRRPVPDNIIPTDNHTVRNLGLYRSRFLKKVIALALATLSELPTKACRDFARCIILHVGQWALDGRRTHTTLEEFRARLGSRANEMLDDSLIFSEKIERLSKNIDCHLYEGTAENLPLQPAFSDFDQKADLVITSPPYPGVHVLYHRWQVDGRKETPAPYWIADCSDGQGASHYTFGDRKQAGQNRYFETASKTFRAVRSVMKDGAYLVQLIAFSAPDEQLPQYLIALENAGLEEVFLSRQLSDKVVENRIWREVPNRKWHAMSKGPTLSAREVVLIHRAV